MCKIGIFYAPKGGSVEKVAKLISKNIGEENVTINCISEHNSIDLEQFKTIEKFIFGISTVGRDNWDNNYQKTGWDLFLPKLETLDLSNKTIAIFGLGNNLMYPDNFVDSMGFLAEKIIKNGAKLVGAISTEGYQFENSAALINGKFCGLPVDEDNESELTEIRVKNWLSIIKSDFEL